MKKKLTPSTLLFILVFIGNSINAQNTFPTGTGANVGIGTTSPASPLDIRVTGTAPTGFVPMALSTAATNSISGAWVANAFTATQTGANASTFEAFGTTAVTAHPSGANLQLVIPAFFAAQHGGAGTVTDMRGVEGALLFTNTAGNVTSAECFYAGSAIIGGGTSTATITNGYGYYMAPFSSNVVNKYGFYINDATASNYVGGSLCIGTTNPYTYKLAVNGSAIFTQAVVKLLANWPDYVFKKGYALPSLDSLSAYIRTNNRLPEMPSAEEVKDKGIDVGANQAALLKKVEELTLYLIRQNDIQQAQQQEIGLLKKKVAELSSNR